MKKRTRNNFGIERRDLSFGPIGQVFHEDGSSRVMCSHGGRRCLFLHGAACTHKEPSRTVDAVDGVLLTPDFCEFKADTIDEINKAQAQYNLEKAGEQ